MKFEKSIRVLPKLLLVAAVLDFGRHLLTTIATWHGERFVTSLHGSNDDLVAQIMLGLTAHVIDIFIFPLGWVTSAATLSVLLSIYDRGQRDA